MLRDIKRKHGISFLVILVFIGFAFATRCLETNEKNDKGKIQKNFISSLEIKQRIYSDSVITRRSAIMQIKERKIKKFIPELMNIILSTAYTSEDKRLSAETFGSLCDLPHIKVVLDLLKKEKYHSSRPYLFQIISTFLDLNKLKSNKIKDNANFKILLKLLKDKDVSSASKKFILDIFRKTQYKESFMEVLRKINRVELRTNAILTLPYVALERQKKYVIYKMKSLLQNEHNYIIRRAIRKSIYFSETGSEVKNDKIFNSFSDFGTRNLSIRNIALSTLLKFKKQELLPYIKNSLKDYELRVIYMTLRLCSILKTAGLETEIEKTILDSFKYLRGHKNYETALDIGSAGIIALGKMKTDKSYEIIKRHMYHYRVKDSALLAIMNFNKDEVKNILERSFYSEPEPIKSKIAEYFYRTGKFDLFIKNLKSPSDIIRFISIKYASISGNSDLKKALKQAFEQEYAHSKWKSIYEKAVHGKL